MNEGLKNVFELCLSECSHYLFTIHPGLFSVVKYNVQVTTGKKRGAGTDANVFVNVFGEQGDTGNRPLEQSTTNKNKFEKGNVSISLILHKYEFTNFFYIVLYLCPFCDII